MKMKSVKDITHNESYIKSQGYELENNIIKNIDVNIIAHFGNITCLTIMCHNIQPYCNHNNIASLGYLIKAFVEFFEKENEDGVMLSTLKNIPCRLIMKGSKAYGIGHFMKDKFILFEDLSQLKECECEYENV